MKKFQNIIDELWSRKNDIDFLKSELSKKSVTNVLEKIDNGELRASEKFNGKWITNIHIKKSIILALAILENNIMKFTSTINSYDKIPLKFDKWNDKDFKDAKIRSVPGTIVRSYSYIGENVILMPSFVNMGAYIDSETLIDTWATIGSCAQIGKKCHISGGVGIGGVIEPIQSNPVIIEDNVFIGARSEISEGVIIGQGSVISMGVYLSQSTKIYNRITGEVTYGYIPPYSVVVPGTVPSKDGYSSLYAAIIVKKVNESTRNKISINEMIRMKG